jgi:hypothetical protein
MHTTATEDVVSYISSQYSVWDYLFSLVERKKKKEEKMSIRTAVHCITHCRREENESENDLLSIFILSSDIDVLLFIRFSSKVTTNRDKCNLRKKILVILIMK